MSIDKKQLSKLIYYFTSFGGGGGVYKSGKYCRFVMNMRSENRDYIMWVKETVEEITSCNCWETTKKHKDGYTRKPILSICTKQHPYFTKVRDRVYIQNHKVIDPHMLTLMDDEALAIIFMTDGGTSLDNRLTNPHCKIDLHTKGYSYADNMSLSKAIYEKCGIRTNLHRSNSGKYFYLNIKVADHIKFVTAILPHMKKSFYYKLERIAPALKYKMSLLDDDIV